MEEAEKRPNFLFWGFIIISSLVHILVFLYTSGVYRSRKTSCIEFFMDQRSKPDTRALPEPRLRKRIKAEQLPVSTAVQQFKMDAVNENFDLPAMPGSFNIASCEVTLPGPEDGNSGAMTAESYFKLVYMRINQFKKYPESAKFRGIEGRVKIQFVLSDKGVLSEIKIIRSSRHNDLDRAALEAVNRASPFPPPPMAMEKAPLRLSVTILFELS